MNDVNVQYIDAALRYLGDEYTRADDGIKGDELNVVEWMKTKKTVDLSFDCPQQGNDYDCGVFHLLNLSLLLEGEDISTDAYLTSIRQRKRCEENIDILWSTSSSRPKS